MTASSQSNMNKCVLMGRATKDPEVRYTQGENAMAIARFTLAVDRRFHKQGEQEADFINCIAFGKVAEHIEKYYRQGIKVAITGRIQTGSYTNKEGNKVYFTEVVVEETEFAEGKSAANSNGTPSKPAPSAASGDGFMNIPDGIDEELPFN